jgi:benzoate/toluate 1,2-dioxygenase beta subunit
MTAMRGDELESSSLRQRAEQFLFHEAALLDAGAWDEWLDLFAPQGMYWVPRTRDQQDPVQHISLFWEDARLRSVRVRRITNERNWSQQPPTYSVRVIGNLRLERATDDEVRVRSSFHMLESRAGQQRAFGGWYTHTLSVDPAAPQGFRIRLKRVDLLNCDAVHENLQVFF